VGTSATAQFERLWGKDVRQAGFTQVPNALIERQAALGLDSVDFNILVQLLAHWWEPDRFPYPSKARLAERVGLSPRQVQRRITRLERDGLIECLRPPGRQTIYQLDPLVVLMQRASREIVAERQERQERDRSRARRKRIGA
jgi:DNA-binding transcriptional ArsR family regulator